MDILMIIVTLILTSSAAALLASALAERLPDIDSSFDRKPFNCRPCLSFHLTWLLAALLAAIAETVALFAGGLLMAFVVFIILWIIDNKKIEK